MLYDKNDFKIYVCIIPNVISIKLYTISREQIYMQMHICIGMSFLKSDDNCP